MDPRRFPSIPQDLVEALERTFPERTPDLTESVDQIRFSSGQVSVVRFIRGVFEAQNERSPDIRTDPNV